MVLYKQWMVDLYLSFDHFTWLYNANSWDGDCDSACVFVLHNFILTFFCLFFSLCVTIESLSHFVLDFTVGDHLFFGVEEVLSTGESA